MQKTLEENGDGSSVGVIIEVLSTPQIKLNEVHVQIDPRRGDSNQTSGYTTGCSCSYFFVKNFFIVLLLTSNLDKLSQFFQVLPKVKPFDAKYV